MSQVNKIRVKVNDIEVSLEGDENFIDKYSGVIDQLLSQIKSTEHLKQKPTKSQDDKTEEIVPEKSLEELAMKFNSDQPANNAHLITAFHYSVYGSDPISFGEVRSMADESGILIPDRVDMTLKQAKKDGHSLYTSTGRGKVKPTIHGQKFFQEEFGVSKGTKTKNEEE